MSVYISHLVDDESLAELIKKYKVGIEGIHFGIASTLDNLEQEIGNYQLQIGDLLGDRELSLHGPFFDLSPASFDSQIRKVTKERFEAVYEAARRLGAKKVVYHTGFIPITYYIEGWLGNSIDFWKEFMENKDQKIQIHLENVYEEEYWPMVKVIDEVNHPAFTACLDIGHVNAYSSHSIEEWLDGLGERIGHVHLHSNDGTRDAHLGLYEGNIDMEKVLKKIQEKVPAATWTIELSDKEKLVNSLEWLEGFRSYK